MKPPKKRGYIMCDYKKTTEPTHSSHFLFVYSFLSQFCSFRTSTANCTAVLGKSAGRQSLSRSSSRTTGLPSAVNRTVSHPHKLAVILFF